MVRFTKESYIIEVPVGGFPAENYVDTLTGLVDLLQSEDEDLRRNRCEVLELLMAMLPNLEQVRAMAANE